MSDEGGTMRLTVRNILRRYKAQKASRNLWIISDREQSWELSVCKDAVYPDSDTVWTWKIDTQFFEKDNWAARYLMRRIQEKITGIRYIKHKKGTVPSICWGTCRHPEQCNTMLCSDCPIAETFWAKREGIRMLYYLGDGEIEKVKIDR